MEKNSKVVPLYSWGKNIRRIPIKKSRYELIEEAKKEVEKIMKNKND